MTPEDPLAGFEFNAMLAREAFRRTGNAELAMKYLDPEFTAGARAAAIQAPTEPLTAPVARPPESKPAPEKKKHDWNKMSHTCPRCGHNGPVFPDFGLKMQRGVQRVQSWCKGCRGSEDYLKEGAVRQRRRSRRSRTV